MSPMWDAQQDRQWRGSPWWTPPCRLELHCHNGASHARPLARKGGALTALLMSIGSVATDNDSSNLSC